MPVMYFGDTGVLFTGWAEAKPHACPACALCCWCRPSQWLSTVVQYIGYSASLKYLLVVLKPGFGGKQLAALKPDVAAMAEAVPASEMTGVIVAAAAEAGVWQHERASITGLI